MQMKAKGFTTTLFLFFISVFAAVVVANPFQGNEIAETHAYHTNSHFQAQDASAVDQFWNIVLEQTARAQVFAEKILTEISSGYQDVSGKVEELKTGIDSLVAHTQEFRIQLNLSHISFDELSQEFELAFEQVGQTVLDEFKEPLPEDQDERYKRREEMISFTLDAIAVAFVTVCVRFGMQAAQAQATFESIQSELHHVISITGNIIDRHPILFESIIYTVLFMICPQSWLLRPLLRVFGFGTGGPMKGSVAAWLQRTFWGGFVRQGSWFAFLQRAGMKGIQWGWWALAGTIWAWLRWFPGWIRIMFQF